MERPEREAAEINHSNLLTEQIMARPQKNNAEYFSHDADMRNDVKVKALRRKFQHTGYAVWCFILESLTDGEYFEIDYNELNRELLAADFDVPVELLEEIVDYCCKVGLLQMTDDQPLSGYRRPVELCLRFSAQGAEVERGKEAENQMPLRRVGQNA